MKEIKAIVDAYLKMDFETHSAALATVVRVEAHPTDVQVREC
jgi:hypothetical protein